MSGSRALTWPGREFDQKGTAPSVEQGHCTLIAVKRYRDPPRIGGRHNFYRPDHIYGHHTNFERCDFFCYEILFCDLFFLCAHCMMHTGNGYFTNNKFYFFSSTQGSVQIELIFRLLLKITVDWPYNAINKCL